MHILFVWSYWAYPEVAIEFLEKIRKRGHRVSVLLADCPKETRTSLSKSGIDLFLASRWNGLSKIVGTPYPIFLNVSRYIKMIDPDVVHVNSHLFLTSFQAVKASRSLGIPSVVTVHGFMAERGMFLNTLQQVFMRLIARSIFKNSSTIICLTKEDATDVTKIVGNHARISIVPNGVDINLFRPSAQKDSYLIAWVGRFVPEKGLVYLLEAMQAVVQHRPKAKLVLAGDGPLKAEVMNLASKLGLSRNITFLGLISRVKVAELLSRSSIFVFPSIREGMPLALLEALASGDAVAASDVDGVNDTIKDDYDAILIPPRNSSELVQAVLTLLDNERLRKTLSENARKTAEEKYSWDKVVERLDHVYESLGKCASS